MGRQLISYMVSSGLVALAEAVPNAMGGYSVNVFWTTDHGDAAEATGADKLEFEEYLVREMNWKLSVQAMRPYDEQRAALLAECQPRN